MTAADFQATYGRNSSSKRRSPSSTTTEAPKPAKPRSAKETAKEAEARREVVGVGRLAWENEQFGVLTFYRKYRLADKAQAEALDQFFYQLTNTKP